MGLLGGIGVGIILINILNCGGWTSLKLLVFSSLTGCVVCGVLWGIVGLKSE